MNVVFLSPMATNAQENEMFNLKKKIVCDQNGNFLQRDQEADNFTSWVCLYISIPNLPQNIICVPDDTLRESSTVFVWKETPSFLAVLFQRLLFIKHAGTTCNNSANELFLLHAVSEMFIPLICLSHLLPKHHLWTREPCSSDREEPLPTTVCYNQKTWFHDSQ